MSAAVAFRWDELARASNEDCFAPESSLARAQRKCGYLYLVASQERHVEGSRTFKYDAVGNKTSETDARNNVTRYRYDVLNRVDLVTDPLSKTIAYTYDAVGNKLSETDKRGKKT